MPEAIPAATLVLRGGRVIDPASGVDAVTDVLLGDTVVAGGIVHGGAGLAPAVRA